MTKNRMARLIESTLERSELVLNAKAIADKLQDMAEDLAKVKADDIMPMQDHLKDAFGPSAANSFSQVTSTKIDELVQAIQGAKDAIGNEIARLERAVNGGATSDMAMDGDAMDAEPPAPEADADAEGNELPAPPGDGDVELPEPDMAGNAEDDVLGAAQNAAGRARKESALPRGKRLIERNIKALRESKNPDALVLGTFRKALAETRDAAKALRHTATAYAIDAADVVSIVREAKKACRKKVTEAQPQKPLSPADMRARAEAERATQQAQKAAPQGRKQPQAGAKPATPPAPPKPAGQPSQQGQKGVQAAPEQAPAPKGPVGRGTPQKAPQPVAESNDAEARTKAELENGLAGWVKDYQAQRKAGNVKGAKETKKKIDGVIASKKLVASMVWGKAPEAKE